MTKVTMKHLKQLIADIEDDVDIDNIVSSLCKKIKDLEREVRSYKAHYDFECKKYKELMDKKLEKLSPAMHLMASANRDFIKTHEEDKSEDSSGKF